MRDELYINGRLVDLGKDTDIKLNYLVSKVYDLSNIMSNYSYTIELPKTANNTQIIDFSDTVNVVTEFPSREHSAEVRRDGAPLFTDGKAYIDSTGETIKVILKWGGSELLSQMQKVKMNEASDITDVLHWNQNLIRGNSLSYATWAGMLDGASSDTQVASRFRPVVKVLPFFDAAFAGNYTIDEKYKSFLQRLWMLLPTTKGNKELVDKIHFELKGSFTDTPTLITYATIGRSLNYTGGYNLCDTFSGEGNNGIYLFPKSGKYNFKIKVWGNYTLAANIIIKIVQEDNAIKPELFKVLEEFTTDTKTLTPILEKEVTIEIEEGAKIEFLYFCDSFPNTFNGNADIQVRFLPSEKDYEETSYMMDYPIRENLPNMTVLDFVKSILGIFGLMAEIKDNIFHFFTMDDVILNKENALDITDFLVNKESEELRYTYGLTQNNILKYEEDELIPKGYGNYSFSANTYAKEENIVAQSKFAAGIPALYKLEDGKYRLQKSDKPRLFFENGKRTLRIGYYDEIFNNFLGEEVECTNFTFDELKYESLVSAFWNSYMSAFTGNARIRKVEVALPPAFMQTFSFQIPVIIDSNYYSVLSVKNYGRNGVAEMELVLLDGITPAKQTPLRNAILESFNTPIKFDYSSVALYSDMDRDTAINGKLIRELDETIEIPDKAYMPVDEGYGSAKKVDVNNIFLHKDRADTAAKPITFQQGITVDTTTDTRDLVVRRLAEILQLNVTEVATLARAIVKEFVSSETFIPGFAGEGFKIWQIAAGEWHGEIDSLTIRRSLNAFELLIQKYRAINGGLVISQGSGKIKSVTEDDTHYLLEMEGNLTLMPDDFIRCQTWGTCEVENYPFDFTDSSKWTSDPYNSPELVSEYTDHSFRVNSILGTDEPGYFLLAHGAAGGGGDVNIRLKITGLAEGDELNISNGTATSGDYRTITSDGEYEFNYIDDSEGADTWTAFVIAYTTPNAGAKSLVIEQVPEKKIETVTNKFYWVKVDGIEEGKVKILKSEFDEVTNIPAIGDEVVQMGNATDNTRQALILLSATDGKPCIDLLAGVNSKTFAGKLQMRAGCLDGIQDPDFPTDLQPSGYGLYCSNAFLKGSLVLRNGKSVDTEIEGVRTELTAIPGLVTIEVGKMQIGAANLILNSKEARTIGGYAGFYLELTEPTRAGKRYTLSINRINAVGAAPVNAYFSNGVGTSPRQYIGDNWKDNTLTATAEANAEWSGITFWQEINGATGEQSFSADRFQLEEGNVTTAWRESTKSLIKAESDQLLFQVTRTTTGTRNYVLSSRMNRTDNAYLQGGTVNLVEDEKFGTVVEYSRPDGGGDFQFTWGLSAATELCNTDVVFSVIAKRVSESGVFNFGGWNRTFDKLNNELAETIDLGDGWVHYWSTLKSEYMTREGNAGSFGINSVGGTWRFYAVGVYKGNKPVDWTAAPEDLESRVSQAELNLQPDNIWLGISNKMSTSVLPRTKQTVDATGLDQNTYYPVTIRLSETEPYTITVQRSLWAEYGVPYWSTHSGGFSVVCKWTTNGAGWGTIAIMRTVHDFRYLHCNVLPVGSISQLTNGSREVIFVRGGSKYDIMVEGTATADIRLHPTTFEEYGQYTAPTTSIVAPEPNWDALTRTGINIGTKEITINAATTKIVSNGQVAALFTTDASGNPIIQGRFLKLTDGAEIAGLTVSGKRLYNSDGQTSIQIGNQTTFPYRCTTISATSLTQVNVYSQDRDAVCIGATSTGADSYALVTRGQVQMAQGSNEHWNVPGVLSIYSKSRDGQDPYFVRVWGTGCPITRGEHQGNSMYKYSHLLGHTDYTVLGAVTSTRFTGYVKLVEKASSYFIVQNLGMSGKPDGAPFDMIILGRNV